MNDPYLGEVANTTQSPIAYFSVFPVAAVRSGNWKAGTCAVHEHVPRTGATIICYGNQSEAQGYHDYICRYSLAIYNDV